MELKLICFTSHDTSPSFLTFDLPKSPELGKKKLKVERGTTNGDHAVGTSQYNIAAKLTEASYTSLHELRQDAALISEQLSAQIRTKHQDDTALGSRPSVDDLKKIQRVQALESTIIRLVEQERQYAERRSSGTARTTSSENTDTNGSVGGTVLTLFGNAPTPRQLFSSAQLPPQADAGSVAIKSELPVEELSLPPGISATKLLVAPTDPHSTIKKRTFADAFAPPHSLSVLPLPKPAVSKRGAATTSLRDPNVLAWEFRDPIQRSKKGGYTVQGLTVGDWLAYGGGHDRSPREKRKAREKALTAAVDGATGEKKKSAVQQLAETEAELAREEAMLFARAYSSFAPSRDDSKSLVPVETKSMVWWQQWGAPRYSGTFALDPALQEDGADVAIPQDVDMDEWGEAEIVDEEAFERIMDDLQVYQQADLADTTVASKTDVDTVLRQISDLLETLASYQHIRFTTLPTVSPATKPPGGALSNAATNIKPDEPTEGEREVYHALRRELAYLLLQLPPYIAAKVSSSQASALGIRSTIPFEAHDVVGSLEEDSVSRQAKLAALTAASAVASLTNSNRPPSSSAGQHYNSTASRTPAIGASANTRYGTQYAPRTPVPPAPPVQYQRTGSGLSQSYNNSPSASVAQRAGWTAQQSSLRPGSTPSTYQQPNGQAQHYLQQQQQSRPVQTPVNYAGGYKTYPQQQQQATPQHRPVAAPGGYSAASPAQYSSQPPRATNTAAANAVAYQANHAAQQRPPSASSAAQGLANGAVPRIPTPNSQVSVPAANGVPRPPSAA